MSKSATITFYIDPDEVDDAILEEVSEMGELLDENGINEVEIRGMDLSSGDE